MTTAPCRWQVVVRVVAPVPDVAARMPATVAVLDPDGDAYPV